MIGEKLEAAVKVNVAVQPENFISFHSSQLPDREVKTGAWGVAALNGKTAILGRKQEVKGHRLVHNGELFKQMKVQRSNRQSFVIQLSNTVLPWSTILSMPCMMWLTCHTAWLLWQDLISHFSPETYWQASAQSRRKKGSVLKPVHGWGGTHQLCTSFAPAMQS